MLIALVLVPTVRIGACVLSMHPCPKDAHRRELESSGDRIVAELEAWRGANGRYPRNFEEGGIATLDTDFGTWRYFRWEDEQSFELRMGDYNVDGWALCWNTRKRSWWMDT